MLMNKVKYLIEMEINTPHAADTETVKAIGKAIIDGAEQNIDAQSELSVTAMNAEYVKSIDLIEDEPTDEVFPESQ